MAITGISSIDNKQIIAAGALSAISANQALITSGGDSLQGLYDTVSTNSGSWTGGGGASYTSPSSTIWISADKIESTNSAYIPSHQEDVLLTATTSWSSTNGYNTLNNTNKVYFLSQGGRISAFDNEGTFLNSSYNTTVLAETEYPPIKFYSTSWVSVKYSAYSAGIMDAYVVELARKNEVNSALNKKLDSSAFTGYYPSNNPSGFAKASDVVSNSSINLFDGRVVGINNQYLMGCDSAYNSTLVGTSAATGTRTASAYVGTGHQGIDIQVSARNNTNTYVNWTAFSENASDLSAGQLSIPIGANRVSALEFNSPLAENISGVKLFGNNQNFTAYSAYTIDVKPLASQNNITFLSGAIDYVSANVGEPDVKHDSSLSGNGTVDSPLGVVPGYNETVLWSGNAGTSAASISEDIHNFETVQLHLQHSTYGPAQVFTINPITMGTTGYFAITRPRGSVNLNVAYIRFEVNETGISAVNSKCIRFGSWTNNTAGGSDVDLNNAEDRNSIIKVVGINRKAQ